MQDIVKKYPKIFDSQNPSPYSQRGIECGEGWFPLIEQQCSLIQYHCDNPDWVLPKTGWIKITYNRSVWNWIIYPVLSVLRNRNLISGDSFYKWHDRLMAPVRYVPPKSGKQVKFEQVKEKFGALRIYYTGGDGYVDGVISLGSALSVGICENCGTNQNVTRNTQGWIVSLCTTCRKEKN